MSSIYHFTTFFITTNVHSHLVIFLLHPLFCFFNKLKSQVYLPMHTILSELLYVYSTDVTTPLNRINKGITQVVVATDLCPLIIQIEN